MDLQTLSQGVRLHDPTIYKTLSSEAYKEYLTSGSIECINYAVDLGQESVRLLHDGDRSLLPLYLNSLGNILWARYKRTGQLDDLERALVSMRKAVDLTPRGQPHRIYYLANLGNQLLDRCDRTDSLDDLEEAIKVMSEAVESTNLSDTKRPELLSGLSNMLAKRYQRKGQVRDLESAIEASREAVNSTPRDDPSNGMYLNNLGNQIEQWYELTSQITHLEEAIEVSRQALNLRAGDHQMRATRLTNLANKLGRRFRQTSQIGDLEEGIELARQALGFLPQEHPDRLACLINLATLLECRYDRLDQISDLTQGVEMMQQAVDGIPQDHPWRATCLGNLANLLENRYLRTGQSDDLGEAIKASRESVNTIPFAHSDRPALINNLSNKLVARYERTGQTSDLDDAIELSRQAVESTPPNHCDRTSRLNNLGYMLKTRYERSGKLDDLEAAIEIARQATHSISQRSTHTMVTNLANYLGRRYERTGQLSNLEEAIKLARKALDSTLNNHPQRALCLGNLGNKLEQRYARTKESSDIEEAIEVTSKAVELTPEDHPDRSKWLHNLTNRYEARYAETGRTDDLQRAIELARQAIESTPPDHPDIMIRLRQLGTTLERRYELNREIADLEEASSCLLSAWNMRSATPFHRIIAGARGLQLFAMQRKVDVAIQLGKEVMELLPVVNTKLLNRTDQQFVVSTFSGVAADMCALLLELNRSLEALKYLEMGRTIIIGQHLDTQSDVSSLRESAPDIAARYEKLLHKINTSIRQSEQDPFQREDVTRRQALAQLETCILQIRTLKGHERFLLSQTPEEMQKCATGGTIVVVNITELRSDIILVSPSAIKTIYLPDLKISEANAWLSKQWKCRRPEKTQRNIEFTEYLSWLWKVCVKKVIEEVYINYGTTDGLPRIWWVGSGLASSMPFHAAGNLALGSTEDALNMSISSYTPSIRALAYSQGRVERIHDAWGTLLLVTMPTTPGDNTDPSTQKMADLLNVDKEKNLVIKICKDMQTDLCEAPSVKQVLESMEKCSIAHFACHGYTNHQDPSNSGLILQKCEDGRVKQDRLTVREISGLGLTKARLAYLSACSTAENNATNLKDEVIHVVSGFQVAGFPHVVGCLWPSNDRVCMNVASSFYSSILSYGLTEWNGRTVASAVREAVRAAREADLSRPLEWAPFVHYGA